MRHNRQKASRKHLSFLHLNLNVTAPYTLLLDGPYLSEGVLNNVPILDRLVGTLGVRRSECRFLVLRSTVDELKSLPGEKFEPVLRFALDELEIVEDEGVEVEESAELSDVSEGRAGEAALTKLHTRWRAKATCRS